MSHHYDCPLLVVPVAIIILLLCNMSSARYRIPNLCIFLSPLISFAVFCIWPDEIALGIYYGFVVLFFAVWFRLSRIPNNNDIKDENDRYRVIEKYECVRDKDIRSIFEEAKIYEREWQKTIAQISISILTACIVFMFLREKEDYAVIYIPVILLFFSALLTLAASALLSLSTFFVLSYPGQEINDLHRGFHRLAIQLARFWHLFPFSLVLLQIVLAGHVAIKLIFS